MEKSKSKSKWIWLIVILIAAISAVGIYKYTESKKAAEEASKKQAENITKRAPETEEQKKESDSIKKKLEDAVAERYRGDGYGVQVFRNAQDTDLLEATVQLDYSKFTDKESCEYVAEKFLKDILGTKNLKSLDIHFGYKDELTCTLSIDDFKAIKNDSDIAAVLKSDKLRFIEKNTKTKDTKTKDDKSKDEKSKDDKKKN